MRRLLDLFSRPATRHPVWVLVGLGLVTMGMGWSATKLEMEVDLAAFADDDSEVVAALDRVQREFGVAEDAVQVLVDAGPGGDVLDADGLRVVEAVRERVEEELGDRIRLEADGSPAVRSLAGVAADALEDRGTSLAGASDQEVRGALGDLLDLRPQLARFISFERDLDVPSARATFVLIELAPRLSDEESLDAMRDVEAMFSDGHGEEVGTGGPSALVFSADLLMDGLLEEVEREMPTLLGLALLVVLVLLWFILRSVTDLVVGLAGLIMIVVWTLGLVVVLGPQVLGWRGEFSQIGIVIPVLLVGLGIDYTVHLVFRHREQRSAGDAPGVAASRSLHTVGAALVLATAATALGFASNAAAPLTVIADVGIFTAFGVICAFVVMALLVSAVNTLRGRRTMAVSTRIRHHATDRLFAAPVWLASRAPVVALAVGAVLAVSALIVSSELETTFDTSDFVPEDSDIGRTFETQSELFGGDLAETTHVIVDGDLGDPQLLAAMLVGHDALGRVDQVRSVNGQAEARSIATLALAAARELTGDADPDLASLAAGIDDLGPLYDQLRDAAGATVVAELLADDATAGVVHIQTTAGTGSETERMREQIEQAFAPVVTAGATITVTSEQLVLSEMAEELRVFQTRSIVIAMVSVLVLLVAYYGGVQRRPTLGIAALLPAAFSATMLFGAMWFVGISFNPVTSTITAISLGIGVPYGIHVVNRFTEEIGHGHDPATATRATIERTGMALTGSAVTTLGAFVVLSSSGLGPVRQLGLLGALSITFALLGALLLEPGALVLWARRRLARGEPVRVVSTDPPPG
ncbi:MAG: efflux RND transporter permease subunit [Acidimicrobiales bacterium]